MIRAMNILFTIALTTGILSGIWGWVAVAQSAELGGVRHGCTAYFACPQGGLKGCLFQPVRSWRRCVGAGNYSRQRAGAAAKLSAIL